MYFPCFLQKKVPPSSNLILHFCSDKNFFTIGQSLSRRAKHISSQYDESGQTVQEMRKFVTKLPQILAIKKSLANRTYVFDYVVLYLSEKNVCMIIIGLTDTTIAELIKETTDSEDFAERLRNENEILLNSSTERVHFYIEDCMARKVDILTVCIGLEHELPLSVLQRFSYSSLSSVQVLRLICIQSVVNNGLKPRLLEQYKRDVVQTYGFQHMLTLANLEKTGLLKVHVRFAFTSCEGCILIT